MKPTDPNDPQTTPRGLEFAERLELLLRLPLDRADDVERWTAASDEVSAWIDAHFGELPLGVPHHLFHYFNDADIQVKEPGYRADQESEVRLFIKQLRGESLPDRKRVWWRFW